MLNLSQLVGVAKALLPANSPWRDRIDQALELSKQFAPTKDGVAQLMAQQGKNTRDFQNALKMLDNPIIKNSLGRVPGLQNTIKSAASEFLNTQAAPTPATPPYQDTQNAAGSDVNSLLQRLKSLR